MTEEQNEKMSITEIIDRNPQKKRKRIVNIENETFKKNKKRKVSNDEMSNIIPSSFPKKINHYKKNFVRLPTTTSQDEKVMLEGGGGKKKNEYIREATAEERINEKEFMRKLENGEFDFTISKSHRYENLDDMYKKPYDKDLKRLRKDGHEYKEIAERLSEKFGELNFRMCRNRYNNYLRPGLRFGGFTSVEDKALLLLYEKYGGSKGNYWSYFSYIIKGRSNDGLKNRYNWAIKKKIVRIRSENVKRPYNDAYVTLRVRNSRTSVHRYLSFVLSSVKEKPSDIPDYEKVNVVEENTRDEDEKEDEEEEEEYSPERIPPPPPPPPNTMKHLKRMMEMKNQTNKLVESQEDV